MVFLGDSLTDGHGIGVEHTYPSLIQRKVDALGWPIEVVNAGQSGDTTGMGLARLAPTMSSEVDVLVVAFGANDCLHNVNLERSRENMDQLLASAKQLQPEIELVLVGVHFPWPFSKRTDVLQSTYSTLAKKHDALWIPSLLKGVTGRRELNAEDNIHPNREGHKVMAETVWKKIRPVLLECR